MQFLTSLGLLFCVYLSSFYRGVVDGYFGLSVQGRFGGGGGCLGVIARCW